MPQPFKEFSAAGGPGVELRCYETGAAGRQSMEGHTATLAGVKPRGAAKANAPGTGCQDSD